MDDDDSLPELTADEHALLASVDELLASGATWAEPSVGLEGSIIGAIQAERRQLTAFPPATIDKPKRRWQFAGLGILAGAAAASLVAVAVSNNDPDDKTAAGPAARFEITGTDLAPTVRGSATATSFASGVQIHVAVPGLPRREGGEFYQMWLKNCIGSHLVPAGTFHEITDAIGWAGVSLADFPIVTVTREVVAGPTDALQGSSGEVVAKGQIADCPA